MSEGAVVKIHINSNDLKKLLLLRVRAHDYCG